MNVTFDRKVIKVTVLIALIYIPARLLFNTEGDPRGLVKANSVLYANAAITLFFAIVLCAQRDGLVRFFGRGVFGISFAYYLIALVSALYSPMPIVTAYQSVIGLFFTLASVAVGRMVINSRETLDARFAMLMQVMFNFSLIATCTNALYFYYYFGVTNFVVHGIPSDFVAVLVIFYAYFFYHSRRLSLRGALTLLLLFALVLSLRSFSAIASFGAALITMAVYDRRPFKAVAMLSAAALAGVALIGFATAGIGQSALMGKPAEAYLTGSGRFDLYVAAVEVYFSDFTALQMLFGSGFMAERVLLMNKDLPWITDPHNSIILAGLGTGFLGLILFAAFALAPFFMFRRRGCETGSRDYVRLWTFFHFFSLYFGLTSSFYIGRPSFLSVFSLAMLYIIYAHLKCVHVYRPQLK